MNAADMSPHSNCSHSVLTYASRLESVLTLMRYTWTSAPTTATTASTVWATCHTS